jgi:glycine cleavage system protein P-like pyridoxal-binding family
VLLRAYIYARMLGREGMQRVAEFATLNANYLMARWGAPASIWRIPPAAPATNSSSR